MSAISILKNAILKKTIQKQTGITKQILPGDVASAEAKARYALDALLKRENINVNNLTKSDLEFVAESIVNPLKNVETNVVKKSADILPFRFKRSFAEELADASKKGDFKRMKGIMSVDPEFKEVMKAFKKSKEDEKAYKKMVGPKKLIPDRDVIPYQSPEVQKLSPAEKLARTTLTEDQYKNVLKKGKTLDDVIYAQDFYGDTAEDVITKITEGEKFPFADGGVAGLLGERQNFAMGRRAFLKLIGGLGAGIGAAKAGLGSLFKISKPVSKLPIIKTDNVAGKPEWFDQLVNKVILEGDDVTKQFATKEREIVHVKTLEKGSNRIDPNTGEIAKPGTPLSDDVTVKVTQDLDDGVVRVEYDSPESMYGDTVQLQYKKPKPDEGDPRPSAEFEVAESGPVGRADGPDDYSIEIDEVGGTSIKDLSSDVSKLKEYATGKKPTMKEIVQNKKRKDKAARISEGGEGEMDEVIRRQGEYIENDLVDLDPGDFASGGRVGFRVGGSVKKFLEKIFGKEAMKEMPNRDPEMYQGMLEVVEMFRNRDKEGLKMYLQKFLPHMDDETIEAFIIGDAVDAAGQGKYGLDNIQGQLIRLGSGRDYAGKIEAFKRLERNKTLKDLEVTDKMKRKPNASGGIAKMLGE
tara:strand:+ start:660 stop:2570 length:1911 start_codon:yes stop_codon:yes gene_type:complete